MNRHHDQLDMEPLYGICHYILRQFYETFFRGEAIGRENIPTDGVFMIASNHASHLDPPTVGCLIPRQVSFFARKTLWKPGFASWWLNGVGTIPVDRDGGTDVLATADDPFHLVHRRALNRPFSEKRMLDVEDELRAMVGELIDTHVPSGTMECGSRGRQADREGQSDDEGAEDDQGHAGDGSPDQVRHDETLGTPSSSVRPTSSTMTILERSG